jgi:hypothetical protein
MGTARMAWCAIPPGSESRACTGGFPRNLGGPNASAEAWNRRAERKRARRGRRDVGVPKEERRRGGTFLRDPAEQRAAPDHGLVRGKDDEDTELRHHLHETRTNSNAGSEPMIRGAGCANRARPDLWGAGEGNLPGLPDDFSSPERRFGVFFFSGSGGGEGRASNACCASPSTTRSGSHDAHEVTSLRVGRRRGNALVPTRLRHRLFARAGA